MKHAFWDRILIILCTLLLIALAVGAVCYAVGVLPMATIVAALEQAGEERVVRMLCGAVALVLVLLAFFTFCIVLPRRKNRSSTFAMQQTEHGTLKISIKALEHLVQKCVAQHTELTVMSSAIHSDEETVRVDLRVTLQSDINIPLAVASLQKQIKQYVEACSGVDVDEVRVFVEATVAPVTGVQSPYAIPDMLQPRLPKLPEIAQEAQAADETPARVLPEIAAEDAWMDAKAEAPETPIPLFQAEPEELTDADTFTMEAEKEDAATEAEEAEAETEPEA